MKRRMTVSRVARVEALALVVATCATRQAAAQTNDDCNTPYQYCLTVQNSTGTDGYGIYASTASAGTTTISANENGNGYGGKAVLAVSTYGTGVDASGYSYGVYGAAGASGGYGGYFIAPGTGGAPALYGNATATGGTGVLGTGFAYGVYGSSINGSGGVGVYGTSNEYAGVEAINNGGGYALYASSSATGNAAGRFISGSYNAIYATNNNTNWNAAVISAGAGNSSGLAYYGNGSINITGEYLQNWSCVAGCGSDERLKKNIEPLKGEAALSALLRLRGVTFEWKDPAKQGKKQEGTQTGLIAQDVEKVFPQWVGEDDDGFKTLTIRQTHIAALEVESFRTLKGENDALKTETAVLRERVAALESGRVLVAGVNLNGWASASADSPSGWVS